MKLFLASASSVVVYHSTPYYWFPPMSFVEQRVGVAPPSVRSRLL